MHRFAAFCVLLVTFVPGSFARLGENNAVQGCSVFSDGVGSAKVVYGKNDASATAYAQYSPDTAHASHFGVLDVVTRAGAADAVQMYAAGFAEGALTGSRMADQWANVDSWLGTSKRAEADKWLATQFAWAEAAAKANATDPFWSQVGGMLAQVRGVTDGAAYACAHPGESGQTCTAPTFAGVLVMNAVGDLLDLMHALDPSRRPDWGGMTPQERESAVGAAGHCTGLVRVTGNFSDLLAAHSSWFTYQAALRIYKHYDFALARGPAASSFSSYPGFLSSLDDFYISPHVIMVQTTNSVMNATLYDLVKPQSLLAYQRVRVATDLAKFAEEWTQLAGRHNSGTYNNQYMVVDLGKFTPGKSLPQGLFWVAEQIPGLWVAADQTQTLERGYWPSYNVPFFREVYDRSGYAEVLSRYGGDDPASAGLSGLDYQLAPRAQIFRRDAFTVTDIPSLKKMMRYNEFQTDPYAKGSPWGAICSRGDLVAGRPVPDGCYDTKVTNFAWALQRKAEVISGPTTQDQAPFSWAQFPNITHQGQPETFDFSFEAMQPANIQ